MHGPIARPPARRSRRSGLNRLAVLWRLGKAFIRESRFTDESASMSRVARFLATHGTRASGLGGGVPALSLLPHAMIAAAGVLDKHPALAETAVRVALAETDALFIPYDATAFNAALITALPGLAQNAPTEVSREPVRLGIAEQTHEARLGDRRVRITLLRPDTRLELAEDLDIALGAARFAEKRSAKARELHLADWLEHASDGVNAMLDLRQRAADQSYLRFRLSGDDRIVVPEVLWDYCSDSVLTTGAVQTVALSDRDALVAHGLNRTDLVAKLIEAFLEMALKLGVYHAGLDATGARVSIERATFGKIVLEADTPAMLFAEHEREFLVNVSSALLRADHKAATREHVRHGVPNDHAPHNENSVEATYRREAERFSSAEGRRQAGIADFFAAIGKAPAVHMVTPTHGRLASRAMLLSRSAEAIEDAAQRIAPDVDLWKVAHEVILRVAADETSCRGLAARLGREAAQWSKTLPRLPALIAKAAASRQRSRTSKIV